MEFSINKAVNLDGVTFGDLVSEFQINLENSVELVSVYGDIHILINDCYDI